MATRAARDTRPARCGRRIGLGSQARARPRRARRGDPRREPARGLAANPGSRCPQPRRVDCPAPLRAAAANDSRRLFLSVSRHLCDRWPGRGGVWTDVVTAAHRRPESRRRCAHSKAHATLLIAEVSPMNKEAIFESWAPRDGIWSLWARPVLFAQMPGSVSRRTYDVSWAPTASEHAVLVVDLPGAESVSMGLSLAERGHRPGPLSNASTPPHESIDQPPIIESLRAGAEFPS